MRKYKPTIANNNELKAEFGKAFKALIYKIEHKKINSQLDLNDVKPFVDLFNEAITKLENSIGTGDENIYSEYIKSTEALKEVSKAFDQELVTVIEEASDNLLFYVSLWSDILENKVATTEDEISKSRIAYSRKKLMARLDELKEVKKFK